MKKKEPKIFLHLFQSLAADISHQINDKNFMDKGIYNPFTFVCAASRLESPPLMVKILKVMGAALRFSSCRPGHSCIFNVFAFSQKVSNWPERQTIAIHDCEEFVLFGFFQRLNLS